MTVTQFNFNDYFENPIVKFCQKNIHEKLPNAVFHVYTLEDVLPIINKLNHSKKALEDQRWSFIGDQLRLYLSLQEDNFFYADADVYFSDMNKILSNKNCTDAYYIKDSLEINNGAQYRRRTRAGIPGADDRIVMIWQFFIHSLLKWMKKI